MRQNNYDWKSRISRAFTQRIYLMPDDSRMASDENEFRFKVMGNTDNAYNVIINKDARAWCECPDCDARGNFCKHLMFVMIRVIGIPEQQVCEDNFEITDRCLAACRDYFARQANKMLLAEKEEERRKPIEEDDDCPICYERFVDTKSESTVWCKAAC
jgi:hypothetical protein